MTAKRIAIIDGHPDPDRNRFVHALADRYAEGAEQAGHDVRRIEMAQLAFPLLRSRTDWHEGPVPPDIARAQETVAWAEHILLLYPLWLGDVPAMLKGFLEQVLRPGFAFDYREGRLPAKKLKGRTAHVTVTMGMPSILYRLYYGAHSVKSLERNILRFVGITPVRRSLIGNVEGDDDIRDFWLRRMTDSGRSGG